MTKVNTTPEGKKSKETVEVSIDILKSMQEEMAALKAKIQEQEVAREKDTSNEVDIDERKHAGEVQIATYKGSPIIDMRLIERTAIDSNGQTVINGFDAVCKVHGTKDEVKITYGDMKNATDYLNLPRVVYKLTDHLADDLAGASRIEKKQLIKKDGTVPENQLINNSLVPTGRVVPVGQWKDIRYYTIIANGEKVELAEDKIYR